MTGRNHYRRPAWQAALGTLALAAALVAGCGMPPGGGYGGRGEGPGGRRQALALSAEQEWKVGRQAFQEVLQKYRGQILPDSDRQAVRVRQVLARLVKASEIKPLRQEINLHEEGYRFAWEAKVVRDRKINAFCLPAGFIVVYTGLLPVAEDDDQLATVLGHEMAHALAHHASERIARAQREGRGILATLADLRFNREQESEADHIGLFLMTFAGYDPFETIRFWMRMEQTTGAGGGLPEILSDHPADARRIRDLRYWAPQALAGKRAYDEGRVAPAR